VSRARFTHPDEPVVPVRKESDAEKLPPEPLSLDELLRQLKALPSFTPDAKRLAGRTASSAVCMIADSIIFAVKALEARVAALEAALRDPATNPPPPAPGDQVSLFGAN
jgi:hypothetical protein